MLDGIHTRTHCAHPTHADAPSQVHARDATLHSAGAPRNRDEGVRAGPWESGQVRAVGEALRGQDRGPAAVGRASVRGSMLQCGLCLLLSPLDACLHPLRLALFVDFFESPSRLFGLMLALVMKERQPMALHAQGLGRFARTPAFFIQNPASHATDVFSVCMRVHTHTPCSTIPAGAQGERANDCCRHQVGAGSGVQCQIQGRGKCVRAAFAYPILVVLVRALVVAILPFVWTFWAHGKQAADTGRKLYAQAHTKFTLPHLPSPFSLTRGVLATAW